MTSGSTAGQRGRALEQQVASYFASHSYQVQTNQVLVGRSGGRHEIDVLAEKSDALTSFRVAVECKASNTPIEKDVVSKLYYVMNDLGLHKGIVISLAGTRSGADTAAESLGIDIWGPEQLRRHLGEAIFADVASGGALPAASSGRLLTGWPFQADPARAHQLAVEAGRGRFGLRSLETVTWFAPLWVPAYLLHLTVAQPSGGRLRNKVSSRAVVNMYDALDGTFSGHAQTPPAEMLAGDAVVLKPIRRETQVHTSLRKAVEARQKVTSQAAIERHNAALTGLGLPVPIHSVSIDQSSLAHVPVYVGLLQREQDRVVAVTGVTGQVSESLSRLLTGQLSYIRAAFPR